MKRRLWTVGWVVFFVCVTLPLHASPPKGWRLAGSGRADYQVGVDRKIKKSGKASGFLRAKATWKKGFGTLMQAIAPDRYKGKRIMLTAWVKAKDVVLWSGLWMRVDAGRKVLAFDNMQTRPIRGTRGWKRYHIVLDVEAQATNISFGLLLSGRGWLWLDDVRIKVVDRSVPLTGALRQPPKPTTPRNSSFEE